MIKIPLPNMALNGSDVFPYSMWNSRSVAKDVTPYWLANNTAAVAAGASGGKLAALVINCHGVVNEKGEFLSLDLGTGVSKSDLIHFKQLKNLVEKIFITSCRAAAGSSGKNFCGELARQTQARVFASDVDQTTGGGSLQALIKGNKIDDYEGQVFEFGNSGEGKPVVLESSTTGD
jgi:hypothetical protein